MSTRSLVLLALSVILLCGSTLAIPRVPAPAAAWARGFGRAHEIPSGTLYKSPTHTFTVVVPEPSSPLHRNWEVSFESVKGDHELVTFAIYIFAQTYRAGIADQGGNVNLDALAKNAAVSRKHQIGLPMESVDESKVNTQFGEASLLVYSIKGGSLDETAHMGEKPAFHDSYIAVLLVPQPGRTLMAVAQDDNWKGVRKESDEAWIKSLRDEVQSFFTTMTAAQTPE
jgi:hypothetical protein